MKNIVKWVAGGIIAGVLFGVLDGSVIVFSAAKMFFSQTEMWRTAAWTSLSVAGAGVIAGLSVGILTEPVAALLSHEKLSRRRFLPESVGGAILAVPLAVLLWLLTSGPQASAIPGRAVIVVVSASILGFCTSWILFRLASMRLRWPLLLGGLLLGSLCYLADLKIMVRLYPAFHVALALCAVFSVTGAVRLFWTSKPGWVSSLLVSLCAIGFLIGGGVGLKKIRATQNPGFVIAQTTALADKTVKLARFLSPPAREKRLTAPPEVEQESDSRTNYLPLSVPQASVFLITVDAMRYDRLKPGSSDPVSPNMNRFAQSAVYFNKAYTPLPHTSYALSSLLTGKYTGPLYEVPGAPPMHETWPKIMRRYEYATGAFFTKAVFFIDRPRFEPYLQSGYGFGTANMEYEPTAEDRVRQTIEFASLQKQEGRKVFTWTHLFEPHEPYEKACTRFGTDDQKRYDCEIFTVDRALGKLFPFIEQNFPQSIVILTADHGEEFGDHGGKYHGTALYDEQIRVPLAIRVTGIPPGQVNEPVNLVDLMGTVLSILDIPVPARVRSNTLEPQLQGISDPKRTAFSQVHGQRMAVRGNMKLIWDQDADSTALYDLSADPTESRSLTEQQPAVVASLKNAIVQWDQSHALVELRPLTDQEGSGSWPVAIQQALGNDPASLEGLMALLRDNKNDTVRRKAARLIYQLSPKRKDMPIPSIDTETDPEVRGWLLAIPHGLPRDVAAAEFKLLSPRLPPFEELWMHGAIIRLEQADTSAAADLIAAINNNAVPIEQRQKAVQLLGEKRVRSAKKPLMAQIDNYPLALDVAHALSRIGDPSVVPLLIKRLKRERFVDRRLAVAQSLSAFKDPRVRAAIATELTRSEPVLEVLGLLNQTGSVGTSPIIITDKENRVKIALMKGSSAMKLTTTKIESITLVGPPGEVAITCNGVIAQTAVLISNTSPIRVNLENCTAPLSGRKSIDLALTTTSSTPDQTPLLIAAIIR